MAWVKAQKNRKTRLAGRMKCMFTWLVQIVSEWEVETQEDGPGAVAHACNPALWEAEMDGSLEVRSSRSAWPTW